MRAGPCFPCRWGSLAGDHTSPAFYLGWILAPPPMGSEFKLAIKIGAKVCWCGCPTWPPPQLKVQRNPGTSVGAPTPSQFPEGCFCLTAGRSLKLEFSYSKMGCPPRLMSPICPSGGKKYYLMGYFTGNLPRHIHTAVGQAYHLTVRDSRSPSTCPHCWVSY